MNQELSESFIKEFENNVNWNHISIHQVLSEDFMREHKDKVNWVYISEYQKLSEDFIMEFLEFLDKFDKSILINKIGIENIKKFGIPFKLFKKFIMGIGE